MAASVPTWHPSCQCSPSWCHRDISTLHQFTQMGLDTDILSRAVGSVVDKPKSVTYTPALRMSRCPKAS
ncbi:hypothetical protein BC827DRAFT_72648 [Russula dissimulans]|nr:hypothetical protein BC827DRAFT_72648 [Russula dissimulans]